MDICRVSGKEEFLAGLAARSRAEQVALLAVTAYDRAIPAPATVALAVALPAICIGGLPRGPYLWVAATLLFELVYPLLLLLAALRHRRRADLEQSYAGTLRALGLLEPGRKLGYLAGNAFVINGRAVAPAFAWFSSLNLLVALGWLVADEPAVRALGVVIAVQAVIALVSGLAVWRMTPGVGRLRQRAAAVRAGFAAHRAIGWTALALLSVPVAFVAVVLVSILVLPGPPLLRVLAQGRVSPLSQFLEFGVLLAGLYGVTRTVHSGESRRLARQVAEAIVRFLDDELRPTLENGGVMDCEDYRVLATGLLESRVYRFSRETVFGRLPVYVLSPDLRLVADPETLSALRGHLNLDPAA